MWLLILAQPAEAVDHLVGPAQPFTDLQSALDVAAPGDRVLIEPGTLAGDVVAAGVDGVEIIGAGSDPATGTVLVGVSAATLITLLDADDLTVSHLVIDGTGARRGLFVDAGSTGLLLDDVRVVGGSGPGGAGLWVTGASEAVLTGCWLEPGPERTPPHPRPTGPRKPQRAAPGARRGGWPGVSGERTTTDVRRGRGDRRTGSTGGGCDGEGGDRTAVGGHRRTRPRDAEPARIGSAGPVGRLR